MSSRARARAVSHRVRRAAVCLPVVLALLAGPGPARGQDAPTTRYAADGGVSVLLDGVEPVVLQPGEPVTLTGRVVNQGSVPSRLTSLTVAASHVPLSSRAMVAAWVDGSVDHETPWVLGDDALGTVLPPGSQETFSITVPGTALADLPDEPSTLAVELTVQDAGGPGAGSADGDGGDAAGGASSAGAGAEGGGAVLRTVLSSSGTGEVETPLETAWVVPLTLPPDGALSSADGTEHAAAWVAAVGEGSTVRTWLDHLTVPLVTWLVDPATLLARQPAASIASPLTPEEEADLPVPAPTEDIPTDPTPDPTGPTPDPTDATPAPSPAATSGPSPQGEVTTPQPAGGSTPAGDTDGAGTTTGATTPGSATATPPDAQDQGGVTGAPTAPPTDDGAGDEPADGGTAQEPADELDVQEAVRELRVRLARASSAQLWWLPVDDPDLAVLLTTPESDAVEGSLVSRRPVEAPAVVTRLLDRGRSDVAWPVWPAPSDQDVDALVELYDQGADDPGLGAVIVPRESLTGDSSASPRRGAVALSGHPGLSAVGADSWTSGLVAASPDIALEQGAGAAAQRVLAHTLGTWAESPGAARELVIAPPRGTRPDPAVLDQLSTGWSQAGWLRPVSGGELLDRAGDRVGDAVGDGVGDGVGGSASASLTGTPPQESVLGPLAAALVLPASPVNPSRGRDLVRLGEDLDGLAQMLSDTDALRSRRPVLTGLWSTRWRTEDEEPWVAQWRGVRQDVRATREAVYVLPSTINFLADQGAVHVTVVNELPIAVDGVHLALEPETRLLQVTGQPDPVSIGPGSRASVPFQARAVTRGETVLTAELTTPDGTQLGQDQRVEVFVQPTGVWIYWVLGGLAGLVLVLGLWRALHSAPRVPGPGTSGSRPGSGAGTAYPGSSPTPGEESTR